MPKLLTKSKFLNGLDSDALLWRIVHQPETIPPPDAFSQQLFKSGTEVGILAQQYFDEGIDLALSDFLENIEQTKAALKKRKPIFEAGFLFDRFYIRVDILVPVGNDEWDIIEVKSSTKLKDTHVHDVAFQRFVLEQCGLKIHDTKIMLVNTQYVRQGELSLRDLFYFENVGEQVSEFIVKVPALAHHMLAIIDLPECPEFSLEELVKGDYSNVFKDEFMAGLPKGSVFELYRGSKKKIIELWLLGIQLIKDLPEDAKTKERHLIQKETAISGKPHINPQQISAFIDSLRYPIYHLDFETFSPAVPPYDGTRAYMQIPFQYSLHIESADGSVEHREYLHTDHADPRRALFEQLHQDIGGTGTVLTFNESFEKGRIKEWAQAAPEYLNWAQNIVDRTQDLITPFRQFYYYHPDQQGSCSIKKVLPVMSDLSYQGMGISNGGEAAGAYATYFVNGQAHDNKAQLIQDMLAYCKLDTWAMVLILRRLRELAREDK
ncbi:DUF2779 domain-containing protein [Olivibacter sitiensis]|uniref:DUF2779 domain-containing protein n=1 Tax=Olivibacter sitiensis TaxID=376470 RepID=UPI000421D17D|nr:DUF2779 domain-containing protein [Olivibacter sitiensis]